MKEHTLKSNPGTSIAINTNWLIYNFVPAGLLSCLIIKDKCRCPRRIIKTFYTTLFVLESSPQKELDNFWVSFFETKAEEPLKRPSMHLKRSVARGLGAFDALAATYTGTGT